MILHTCAQERQTVHESNALHKLINGFKDMF